MVSKKGRWLYMQGMTPAELAMMKGHFPMVEMLMEKYGCQVNQSVLKVPL